MKTNNKFYEVVLSDCDGSNATVHIFEDGNFDLCGNSRAKVNRLARLRQESWNDREMPEFARAVMRLFFEMRIKKGRASWIWQKMHARDFSEKEARHVMRNFGGGKKLFAVPNGRGGFNLRNSAGCYVHALCDDDAPYKC